jgi:hypothetical protein
MKRLLVVAILGILLTWPVACTVTCPPCPTCEPCPTVEPTPAVMVPTATPPTTTPACWDPRLDEVGVTLERRNGQYELVAAWVTVNGSWDDVVACAKPWQRDTLGGDHNAFGRAETATGAAIAETFALIWPDGGDTRQIEPDGWANIPIYGGGGKYDWFVYGGDKLHGLTMPGNHHWSFFAVWQPRLTLYEMDMIQMEVLR